MRSIVLALKKNEVNQFFLGIGEYTYKGRLDEDVPNDFPSLWLGQIVPTLDKGGEIAEQLPFEIQKSLFDLLEYEPDIARGIYTATCNYFWYFNFRSKNQVKFDLATKEFEARLTNCLVKYESMLRTDIRWTRNNEGGNGILRLVLVYLSAICQKYNGFCLDLSRFYIQ